MRPAIGIIVGICLILQTQIGSVGSFESSVSDSSEFFALLIGISDYESESCGIPAPPFEPYPNWTSRYVYNTLIDASNWQKQNIVLLVDDQATFQGIVSAFEELSGRIGPEDVFVFCFNGHGAQIIDEDGDEAIRNESDRYDEAICPYDSCLTHSGMINVISDDMLSSLIDSIAAESMVLCFECCFSGGLDEEPIGHKDEICFDVQQSGRAVLMSTCEECIGFSSWVVGWPLMFSFSKAICDERCDVNADGWVSVQEAWPKTYELDWKLIAFQQFRFEVYGKLINRAFLICDELFSSWVGSVGCSCFFDAVDVWMDQYGSSHVTLWRIWQSAKVLSAGSVRNDPWMCYGCIEPICLVALEK